MERPYGGGSCGVDLSVCRGESNSQFLVLTISEFLCTAVYAILSFLASFLLYYFLLDINFHPILPLGCRIKQKKKEKNRD